MKRLLRKLADLELLSSIPADDILARQRYSLFRIASLLGIVLLTVNSLEGTATGIRLPVEEFLFPAIALTLLINYVGLQFHRNVYVAYTISIVAALSLIHGVTYYMGGIRNPDFFYMGSIILYSYVILEHRGGRITLVLSLLNIIYFYALTDVVDDGAMISYDLNDRQIDAKHLYTAITSMVIMTSLSSYLAYSKNAVIRKIEESRDVLERKNEELQELSVVASETINSVIVTGKSGLIEWVNDGFTRLTGYESGDVIGKRTDFLFGTKSDPATMELLVTRTFPTNNFSAEIIKYRKNGDMIWVQENVTRIRDEEENTVKYIFMEMDVTERKKSEERMSDYLNSLEKTNKELDKFAYVVSHDLKAPLRAIGNLTGWIEEDAGHMLPDDVRRNFNLIKERVVRMEALINGILDYSKVSKRNNQVESFDVNHLVREVIDLLGNPADCTFALENPLPEITADKVKLQQVFLNLIGNAIKFNNKPEKKVTISSATHADHYQFTVIDNGPGIDERFHSKIFIIFQTINTRDEFESTGVGLAIVKKIIEEQQGKIWIESTVGNGSAFHFTWPRYRSDMEAIREFSTQDLTVSDPVKKN
jgi:PAS domain S-box-containing protein